MPITFRRILLLTRKVGRYKRGGFSASEVQDLAHDLIELADDILAALPKDD
jgi:hypothetical protein